MSLAEEVATLRKEVKALERENRRLKEENEFLAEASVSPSRKNGQKKGRKSREEEYPKLSNS